MLAPKHCTQAQKDAALEEATKNAATADAAFERAQAALTKAIQDTKDAHLRLGEVRGELQVAGRIEAKDAEIVRLNAQIDSLRNEVAHLTSQADQRDRELDTRTEECSEAKKRTEQLDQSLLESRAKVKTLTETIESQPSKIGTLEAEVVSQSSKIATLEEDMARLEQADAAKAESLGEKQVELDGLRGQVAHLEEQCRTWADRVKGKALDVAALTDKVTKAEAEWRRELDLKTSKISALEKSKTDGDAEWRRKLEDKHAEIATLEKNAMEATASWAKRLEDKTAEMAILEEKARQAGADWATSLESNAAKAKQADAEWRQKLEDKSLVIVALEKSHRDAVAEWRQRLQHKEKEMATLQGQVTHLQDQARQDATEWQQKLDAKAVDLDRLEMSACQALGAAGTLWEQCFALAPFTDWRTILGDQGEQLTSVPADTPEGAFWAVDGWSSDGDGTCMPPAIEENSLSLRHLVFALGVGVGSSARPLLPQLNKLVSSLSTATDAPVRTLVQLLRRVASGIGNVESEERAALLNAIQALHLLHSRFESEDANDARAAVESKLNEHSLLLQTFIEALRGGPDDWTTWLAARKAEGRVYTDRWVILDSQTHAVLVALEESTVTIVPIERMEQYLLRHVQFHGRDRTIDVIGSPENLGGWWFEVPQK